MGRPGSGFTWLFFLEFQQLHSEWTGFPIWSPRPPKWENYWCLWEAEQEESSLSEINIHSVRCIISGSSKGLLLTQKQSFATSVQTGHPCFLNTSHSLTPIGQILVPHLYHSEQNSIRPSASSVSCLCCPCSLTLSSAGNENVRRSCHLFLSRKWDCSTEKPEKTGPLESTYVYLMLMLGRDCEFIRK